MALLAGLLMACTGSVSGPDAADAQDAGQDDGGPTGDDGGPTEDDGAQTGDDGGPAEDDGAQTGDDGGPTEDDGAQTGDDGGPAEGHYFPPGAIWTQEVFDTAPAPDSDAIIACLRAAGGWGNQDVFQIDFSIEVLQDDGSAPMRAFEPTSDFYSPDCDHVPVPVPAGGALEGETGYACDHDGDCHLIVVRDERLYEMWRADIRGDTFRGGCLAVWDLARVYGLDGRGQQCTSADAAGFPIAPLLFSADEVAAGEIRHAIRFILPNDRVRRRTYVPPATHGTNTTGGPACPPYGVHFRLRRDYPLERLPHEAARVVARALQRYGMFHADGGSIALTARSDRFTARKWSGLLGPRDLSALRVEDFEVISHGEPIPVTYDCVRAP
jgi:serine/threonine-protein kinase